MDRTVLLAKVYGSTPAIDQGRKWLDTDGLEHEGRINYRKGLTLGLEAFWEAQSRADGDLRTLFSAEYTFLTQEREVCSPQDTKAKTSLAKALQEFGEAFLALEVLQDAERYQSAANTYSTRPEFRYKEMPKDAFHVACAGHRARIDNILKVPGINLLEKDLLKQRHANRKTAQSVYLEMQKKVLVINHESAT
ncbi:MAG: hypothetical protein LBG27_09185 [Spirochaetaceae bacterium]|nr:hypothetical protein [Spirochaetaceae bacterium]